MGRYLVFAGLCYYPGGGWHDFVASFADRAAAEREGEAAMAAKVAAGKRVDEPWYHVVDTASGKIVAEGYTPCR